MGLEWIELVLSVNAVDFVAHLLDSLVFARLIFSEGDDDFCLDADQESIDEVRIALHCVEIEKAKGNRVSELWLSHAVFGSSRDWRAP